MKTFLGKFLNRMIFVCLALLAQIFMMVLMFTRLAEGSRLLALVFDVLAVLVALAVINRNGNPAYKIAWLIPVLVLPLFGTVLFLMFGHNRISRRQKRKMLEIETEYARVLGSLPSAGKALAQENADAALQSSYLEKHGRAPVYQNTRTVYLKSGEIYFESLLEALRSAKKFIFLEYFIIEPGKMWSAILDILEEKVKQGVDVRVMYDDFGCILKVPSGFDQQLRKRGIQCLVFRRFVPVLSSSFNNRDHRKIVVVDGNIAFTGGVNLADEYINEVERFGHWQDCGIRIEGAAVWSFTAMFLSFWNYYSKKNDLFNLYLPDPAFVKTVPNDGFVQPYTDMPLDSELVGETAYLNLIHRARKSVYICTPYLILDNETVTALSTAAKQGVDVRIITPHIPDKKLVHALSRSYYAVLIRAGVRIYEYTPGFIHSKTFVVDSEYAVCGSINLDFRSLYLHYECAVWMYRSSAVSEMEKDYFSILSRCEEITPAWCRAISIPKRLLQSILRAFAPLL